MENDNAIIVFVKFPQAGKVKTRLARTSSENFALEFYKLCAEYTMSALDKLRGQSSVYVYYSGTDSAEDTRLWLKREFIYRRQIGGDLGERMFNAFQDVLRNQSSAVIIGTDVPGHTAGNIWESLVKLESCDAVIAPAGDGGYSLLCLKRLIPELFKNIECSTHEVFPKTVQAFEKAGIYFSVLEELPDIDTMDDLTNWLTRNHGHPLRAGIQKLLEKEGLK